ncbi:hypothetical protein OSH11_00975 [Kaistia dalseonensis]|uniref:Uncharacterized protein n=1 Tax=Kaistia dalseonensis TaxID=410840 RepID=A0ABU0H0J2_9HYPH|nr:hypothetical protein [Kaistia dalseonensis]MCX5493268.1 hypothetical protein [Kaistia dalseonensis]MDQ0435825.1 hypothetical protein [Kaistia dalseonensis]
MLGSQILKNRRQILDALALGSIAAVSENYLFSTVAAAEPLIVDPVLVANLNTATQGDGEDTVDVLSNLGQPSPVYVPYGEFLFDKPMEFIRSRLHGLGQIRATDGVTPPYYSMIDERPQSVDGKTIGSAFEGDISRVNFAVGHVIKGADTLGHASDSSPDVLRVYTPEAYATVTFLHNESGSRDLGGRTDMRGATMATAHLTDVVHLGRGDSAAYVARSRVSGQNPDSEHVINNAWGMGFVSEIRAQADGVFLLPVESAYTDSGFDVGSVGHLLLGRRTNNTGEKYANWIGYVAKSVGGDKPWDVFYTAYGSSKIGIDFTQAYFESEGFEGAAMVLSSGQRIYFDGHLDMNIPAESRWKCEDPGDIWIGYDSADKSITIRNGDQSTLSLSQDGLALTGNLGLFGAPPASQPKISGSRSDTGRLLGAVIGALVELNLVEDLTVD